MTVCPPGSLPHHETTLHPPLSFTEREQVLLGSCNTCQQLELSLPVSNRVGLSKLKPCRYCESLELTAQPNPCYSSTTFRICSIENLLLRLGAPMPFANLPDGALSLTWIGLGLRVVPFLSLPAWRCLMT